MSWVARSFQNPSRNVSAWRFTDIASGGGSTNSPDVAERRCRRLGGPAARSFLRTRRAKPSRRGVQAGVGASSLPLHRLRNEVPPLLVLDLDHPQVRVIPALAGDIGV